MSQNIAICVARNPAHARLEWKYLHICFIFPPSSQNRHSTENKQNRKTSICNDQRALCCSNGWTTREKNQSRKSIKFQTFLHSLCFIYEQYQEHEHTCYEGLRQLNRKKKFMTKIYNFCHISVRRRHQRQQRWLDERAEYTVFLILLDSCRIVFHATFPA